MSQSQGFRDRVTLADFDLVEGGTAGESVEVNDSTYTTIYTQTFEKGEGLALGQGSKSNQTDATGRAYLELDGFDGAAAYDIVNGKVRFVVLNRQNNSRRTIGQFTLGQLANGANDNSARTPFPVQERGPGGQPVAVSYPWALGIQVKLNDGVDNIAGGEDGTTAELDSIRVEQTR